MTTIGKLIRDRRLQKGLSYQDLEDKTRIRLSFLKAIELNQWDKLPEYPVVLGFVKNVAFYLDISEQKAVAFLRRDFPNKKTVVSPKPDISKEFHWSPKLTFIFGVVMVVILVVGYLIFQYFKFSSPPSLRLDMPQQNQKVTERSLKVSGKTDQDAIIKVNNQPVLVNDKGEFETTIDIFEGTSEIKVVARSRSGKVTEIERKIKPELK